MKTGGGVGIVPGRFRQNRMRQFNSKASVTKRRGIGPIRTEISPYKIRKELFIFQIVRFNGICIWQHYFCIMSNVKFYLINQKRNTFIKHCPPPPVYQQAAFIRDVYIVMILQCNMQVKCIPFIYAV